MKNLAKYNNSDKIGTEHWYRTLIIELSELINGVKAEKFKEHHEKWLEQANNIVQDLYEWNSEGNISLKPNNEEGIFIGNKYYSKVDIEALGVIAQAYNLLVNKEI